MSNTSGVLQEAGTAYPLLANGFPPPPGLVWSVWYWDTVMNEYFALMGSIDCPVSVLTTTTSHKRLLSILIFVQSWQRVVP